MNSDTDFTRAAQALAQQTVLLADSHAWESMHRNLTFFLAGARSSHEEGHHSHQLHLWKTRLLTARAAGDAMAETNAGTELSTMVVAELRHRGDAMAQLLATFPVLTGPAAAEPQPSQPPQPPAQAPQQQPADEDPGEFLYADVFVFVTEYLANMLRRRVNGSSSTWCPRWWAHPEAGARLTALWLAWEHLRQEPGTGMSTWWLHHADPHLRVLMDPDMGPFAACSPKDGHTAYPFDPLPLEPYDASQDPLA
ncbi:DUF4913 domain-containing protein [Streptomyces sp. P9(2023)]|uniref:DUF4913 domain-containing protein n=1 Tax=Streptomyces sp. P9(2023) TaxID=3064394 RepID=UPI0028F44EA5|nr:DUF4913 domain-containing protein [Streptomyces sp. P9(2023)]MDT9688409.1 DUF4913 domain-containing protein [Streptomyces sp. P9(2023)]